MRRAALVVLALLLAGCGAPEAPPTTTSPPATSTPVPTPEAPPAPWEPLGDWRDVTLHLTTDHRLVTPVPGPGRVALQRDAYTSPTEFVPVLWLGEPFTHAVQIEGPTARFRYEADQGMVTARSGNVATWDLHAWVGDATQLRLHHPTNGPDALVPGEPQVADASFLTPPGGLVLPAGARPAFFVAPTYLGRGDVWLRVGGEDASRVTLRVRDVRLDETARVGEVETRTGSLSPYVPGSAPYAGPHVASFDVTLGPSTGATELHASVRSASAGSERHDLDLYLLPPQGDVTLESASPSGRERLDLYAPNDVPDGAYRLLVRNRSPVASSFTLEFELRGPVTGSGPSGT